MLSCQGSTGQCCGSTRQYQGRTRQYQGSREQCQASREQCQVSREQCQGSTRQCQVSITRPVTCQDPALGTSTHHSNSHRQQHLCHCPAPSEMVCVPRQAARWDSEAIALPCFHLPSSHLQSNLMSSSNTLAVAWQQQYQHRNSCTGMEMVVLAWQHCGREIKMSGRSLFLLPRATKLPRFPWMPRKGSGHQT